MFRRFRAGLTFDQGRAVYALCMACTVGMALHFAADIVAGRNTITPDLYGPVVYAIPAHVWAAAQAGFAGLSLAGLLWGGRAGAALSAVGAALTCALFLAFGYLAGFASEGTLVVAMCKAVGVPITGTIAAASLEKAMRNGQHTEPD